MRTLCGSTSNLELSPDNTIKTHTTRHPPGHHRDTTGTPPGHHRDTTGTPPGHHRDTTGTPPGHHRDTTGATARRAAAGAGGHGSGARARYPKTPRAELRTHARHEHGTRFPGFGEDHKGSHSPNLRSNNYFISLVFDTYTTTLRVIRRLGEGGKDPKRVRITKRKTIGEASRRRSRRSRRTRIRRKG